MPALPVEYVRQPYVRGASLGQLLQLQGRNRAEAELRRGEIGAQMWGQLGQQITGAIASERQAREQAPRLAQEAEARALTLENARAERDARVQMSRQDTAYATFLEGWDGNQETLFRGTLSIYGPQRGPEVAKRVWEASRKPAPDLMPVNPGDVVIDKANPSGGAVFTAPATPAKVGTREVKRRNADGSETIDIVEDTPGQSFTSAAAQSKAAVGSFEDYVTRAYGNTPTPQQIVQARKDYQQADDRPRISVTTESGLSPTMEANIINRLTTQWGSVSAPAKELTRQVSLMDAGLTAARRGDLAQGSQAVLVTFQKILDPTSVVRESEYMRSAAGQSLLTRIEGAAEQLAKGGAGVPLRELEKFAALAREAAKVQQEALPALQDRIGKTADRYKIPRELIFEGAKPTGDADPLGLFK